MHVSNLLKAVLKPCNFSSKSSNQTMAASKATDGGSRPVFEPRKIQNKQLQERRRLPSHAAPKMTCLCAPTTHPGSFRCRFHRACASRTSSVAREVPLLLTTSPRPTQRSHNDSSTQKQVVPTMLWLAPIPHRSRPRPSRLSRVVVATQSDNACFNSR